MDRIISPPGNPHQIGNTTFQNKLFLPKIFISDI
jgi:hypothetical protein